MTSNRSTTMANRVSGENQLAPNPEAVADVDSSPYTFVRLGVPLEAFALDETLSLLPDAEFEVDQGVQCGNAVMPLLWARDVARPALEATFDADSTVECASLVDESDGELLYHMEWGSRVRLLTKILTNSDAVIRDAHATAEGWTISMVFSTREHVSEVCATSEEFNISVTVSAIYGREENPGTMYGLTDEQREAMVEAQKRGYFEVPRAIDLDEIAEEMGISHQSLSERLRRAHDVLIANTIRNGDCSDA